MEKIALARLSKRVVADAVSEKEYAAWGILVLSENSTVEACEKV